MQATHFTIHIKNNNNKPIVLSKSFEDNELVHAKFLEKESHQLVVFDAYKRYNCLFLTKEEGECTEDIVLLSDEDIQSVFTSNLRNSSLWYKYLPDVGVLELLHDARKDASYELENQENGFICCAKSSQEFSNEIFYDEQGNETQELESASIQVYYTESIFIHIQHTKQNITFTIQRLKCSHNLKTKSLHYELI